MATVTRRIAHKATGKAYWVERRIGFRGIEWNFGGGWRSNLPDAHLAAVLSGELRPVADADLPDAV